MTPSTDELPARTSAIVRLSQNGLVVLALFYALVLGTTLPLGTLARTTIDRIELNAPSAADLAGLVPRPSADPRRRGGRR